jgi:hypothetical protein
MDLPIKLFSPFVAASRASSSSTCRASAVCSARERSPNPPMIFSARTRACSPCTRNPRGPGNPGSLRSLAPGETKTDLFSRVRFCGWAGKYTPPSSSGDCEAFVRLVSLGSQTDLSPSLSKPDKYPSSKTEQEKGGWSCATSRRSLRPAVLGVSGLLAWVVGFGHWCGLVVGTP